MLRGAGTREGSRRRDLLEHCLAHERRGSAESGREGLRVLCRDEGALEAETRWGWACRAEVQGEGA